VTLHYRPSDDTFVILDGEREVAFASASLALQRQLPDEKAMAVGLRRFLTFVEWQVRASGTVLWHGNAEDAMQNAPRL
jgi:hypothetical protein